jgi:hypothetical protein
MSWTLQDVQNQIASEIDQSESIIEGDTDWNIRLNAINRALIDYKDSNDWESLKVVFDGVISTSTGNASLVLPADFNKLDSYPRIVWDGTTMDEFPAVDPSKNTFYTSSDKYVNILENKTMYIHSSGLVSGASVQFTYYKSPQSLASATDVIIVNDPTYLVQRSLYYIYKSREDARFPEAKIEADRILGRMMENENSMGFAYLDRNISSYNNERSKFRIGRDG